MKLRPGHCTGGIKEADHRIEHADIALQPSGHRLADRIC